MRIYPPCNVIPTCRRVKIIPLVRLAFGGFLEQLNGTPAAQRRTKAQHFMSLHVRLKTPMVLLPINASYNDCVTGTMYQLNPHKLMSVTESACFSAADALRRFT